MPVLVHVCTRRREGGTLVKAGVACLSDDMIAFSVVQEILEEESSGLP
jgi:hypothetical protein